MNKKEKSFEYAKMRYGNNGNETQNEKAKMIACRVGYEAGWDEALKNQWVKVADRTPHTDERVLVLFKQGEEIRTETDVYYGDAFFNRYANGVWHFGGEKVIAWMPIPSFDKILEDNKDVLKRLKDK